MCSSSCLVSRYRPALRPVTQTLNTLLHCGREWTRAGDLGAQIFHAEGAPCCEHTVERRHHNLLDFGAAETFGRSRQRGEIECVDRLLSALQVQPKNRFANIGVGQVDKKYLVESTFAYQLRGQPS